MKIRIAGKLFVGAIALVGSISLGVLTWGDDVFDRVSGLSQSLGLVESDRAVHIQAAAHKLGQTTADVSYLVNAYNEMPDGPQPLSSLPDNLNKDPGFVEKYSFVFERFNQTKAGLQSLKKELELSTNAPMSAFRHQIMPYSVESSGSRLIRDEINRRYGEHVKEAFQLGLEIKGAMYQSQKNMFEYGEIPLDGISGITTYSILAERAGTFGVIPKPWQDIQRQIDHSLKFYPGDQVKAKEETNIVIWKELGGLDRNLSSAISEHRSDGFVRMVFLGVLLISVFAGTVVFLFRLRQTKTVNQVKE